jgi:hypothetical protein
VLVVGASVVVVVGGGGGGGAVVVVVGGIVVVVVVVGASVVVVVGGNVVVVVVGASVVVVVGGNVVVVVVGASVVVVVGGNVVVVVGDDELTQVCDSTNLSFSGSGTSVLPMGRARMAVPPVSTSSVGVITYACLSVGGPNEVIVMDPAVWNVTVSDEKIRSPPPAERMKCHAAPPTGTAGAPLQF